VKLAGGHSALEGGTAYLNLEPGQCHGDDAPIQALLAARVSRVVIGIRHPMKHFRGEATEALRRAGVNVDVVDTINTDDADVLAVLDRCRAANAALACRAETGKPLGVLKYAMTLDGKIAASSGHAAWVSCEAARARVYQMRAESDAVVVGGNTVRRDNPRLTTRRESGHRPLRVVLSRSMNLPIHDADYNIWNTSEAPTLVMTQRGAADEGTLDVLRSKYGVEVVEFDILTADVASNYLARRGCLQVLWESGGNLSAPAISEQAVHKVVAFVAPKIVGGPTDATVEQPAAPTPVGDLGNIFMTQAIELKSARYEQVGTDMCVTGYLNRAYDGPDFMETATPSSQTATSSYDGFDGVVSNQPMMCDLPHLDLPRSMVESWGLLPGTQFGDAAAMTALCETDEASNDGGGEKRSAPVHFYKAWMEHGALTNFSPHEICVHDADKVSDMDPSTTWPSVEHFYQASKFDVRQGTQGSEEAEEIRASIGAAPSPEEAARIGRTYERTRPDLVYQDWTTRKVPVMEAAIRAKFTQHNAPRRALLNTGRRRLVEDSVVDSYWGGGRDRGGLNHLGRLLMELREELRMQESVQRADVLRVAASLERDRAPSWEDGRNDL